MNKQEYLDLLIKTGEEGGFPSMLCNGCRRCVYRAPNGKKCAVGIILPDAEYSEGMDDVSKRECLSSLQQGSAIDDIIDYYYSGVLPGWFPEGITVEQMRAIQAAHDDTAMNRHVVFGKGSWDQQCFVNRLRECGAFKDCVFPEKYTSLEPSLNA